MISYRGRAPDPGTESAGANGGESAAARSADAFRVILGLLAMPRSGPMTTLRVLAALALLAGSPAAVQAAPGPAPVAVSDDPSQVSELVVVAHPQGPAMWRVTYGGAELTILGSVTPIHHQQKWDHRQLQAALDGARLVILPPKVGLEPLQFLALATADVWRVRTFGHLEARLSPYLRARFEQECPLATQPRSRYAHWKPAAAGFLLLSDSRRIQGYSMGKPGTTVEKIAKGMRVPTRPIGNYSVNSLISLATGLDDKQNLACLDDVLAQADYERAHVADLNDDWARGNVLAVNARYRLPPLQRCLMMAPGARKEIEKAMAEAAGRLWSELQKPGKTVAVVDMAWLLPQDGLLDRLKTRGAVVSEPPQLVAARADGSDADRD